MDIFLCPSINYEIWNIPLATNHWIIFKIINLEHFINHQILGSSNH